MTASMRVTGGTATLVVGENRFHTTCHVATEIIDHRMREMYRLKPVDPQEDRATLCVNGEGHEAFIYIDGEMRFNTRSQEPVEVLGCTVAELMGLPSRTNTPNPSPPQSVN